MLVVMVIRLAVVMVMLVVMLSWCWLAIVVSWWCSHDGDGLIWWWCCDGGDCDDGIGVMMSEEQWLGLEDWWRWFWKWLMGENYFRVEIEQSLSTFVGFWAKNCSSKLQIMAISNKRSPLKSKDNYECDQNKKEKYKWSELKKQRCARQDHVVERQCRPG